LRRSLGLSVERASTDAHCRHVGGEQFLCQLQRRMDRIFGSSATGLQPPPGAGPGRFDRIQVRQRRWEKAQTRTLLLHDLARLWVFVRRQVVPDDHVALSQLGHILRVGARHLLGGGPANRHPCGGALGRECANPCDDIVVIVGHMIRKPLEARRPRVVPRRSIGGHRLIDEKGTASVNLVLMLQETGSKLLHSL